MCTAMNTRITLGLTVPIALVGLNAARSQVPDKNELIGPLMKAIYQRAVRSKVWRSIAAMLGLLALVSTAVAQTSTPLRINCPPNRTNWHCGVASTAVVMYPAPTTTGSCPTNALVTCIPPSGSTFILGTTTVSCRATNSCRQSATCSFTITVARDTVPPVIQCPTNRLVGLCGTTSTTPVTFPLPAATDNADTNVTVSCSPPSGSLFPIGTTTVTCTATDDCTNRTTCPFTVTVARDTTPPSMVCPASISVTACSASGAVVNYPTPTATDNADFNVAVTCSPASGSVFPLGSTTVTCTATDDCTNRSTCIFTVTVNADTVRPVITCPSDQTVWTCYPRGVVVNYPSPPVSDNHDPNPSVVCGPPSSSLFPMGQTVVTCTATDGCTNRSVCVFRVTVNRDTTPPEIFCPTNLIVWSCDANGIVVNYPAPTVNDAGDATPTVVCVPPSGSVFPHGVTVVTSTATDDCTNRSSCSFEVRVGRVTIPPTIECPPDRAMLACSPTGRVVSFQLPTAHDNSDASPTVNCAPPSGGVFLLGVTEVTCTALDACGNRAQCTFRITVGLDTEPPVFSCPSNIVVQTCDLRGVVVN